MLGGASLLPLPPGGEDLEMGWHLHPSAWRQGYATESKEVFVAVGLPPTTPTSCTR